MNNLTTRKIVLGLLMTLVLAFSVQGIADALTLTVTSGETQSARMGSTFEMSFTVGLTGDTVAYHSTFTSRRVNADVPDQYIDSSGYEVAYTGTSSTNYRTLDGDPSPPPGRGFAVDPRPEYSTEADGITQSISGTVKTPLLVDTSGNLYDSNGKRVYLRSGSGNRVTPEKYVYVLPPTPTNPKPPVAQTSELNDYNDEAISITTVRPSGATGTLTLKSPSFTFPATAAAAPIIGPDIPGTVALQERMDIGLPSSITLVYEGASEGAHTIIVSDATPQLDFPVSAIRSENRPRKSITFTIHVTPATTTIVTGTDTITPDIQRIPTNDAVEPVKAHLIFRGENNRVRYEVVRGSGTLYVGTLVEEHTTPSSAISVHQASNVYLKTNGTSNEVHVSFAGEDRSAPRATIIFEYRGQPVPTTRTTPVTPVTPTGSLTIVVTGTGATRSVTVNAVSAAGTPTAIPAVLTGTATSTQTVITGTATEITLPTTPGSYTLTATASVTGYAQDSETITVAGPTSLGTISISQIGTPTNGVQTFSITVRRTDGTTPAPLTVTVSGTGFTTSSVPTANGSGAVNIALPTTAGLYTLTARATGYTSGPTTVRISGTGQQQQQPAQQQPAQQQPTVSEPDSIEITGPSTRSGTVNEELDTPLLVRVLDDDGDGLEGARVFYRVTGRGRISDGSRGGRSIGVITDDDGYARANFTPTAGGSSTVRVNTDDVSRIVTFTITTGSAPGTRDAGTGVTPGASTTPGTISPVVHVAAASRPPMLWVDGGAIYALVGASPQRFAASVDNALNITVAGGKVYWTEKTGESGGTINSANLNGSGVTELASIFATPMGIAVDVTNSKLYWTNSAGRIQSANLDGSRITNELQNLASPMDIALAGGNAYWTQGGNVRFVNLRGQKVVRNVSTGMDTAGSLAIGGGKVYWTEMTGESGGTVNSANLNGTGATQLASILAAPMGIAVDGSRSKLYWSNARGRIQSANLDGSGIKNVVSGLGSPGELVLSNSIATPTAATTTTRTTTTASKYDLNSDGTVDNTDAGLVADAMGTSNARYDVNGDGTVNFLDLLLVFDNRDPGAAGAPTIVGMKMSAAQIDIIEEQIDLLIATNDRSPSAMRVLVYLQQLLVTARPEKTQLLANYPNPFNPETWIPYELATDTHVKVTIYNTQGVVIRTLQFGHQSAGYYVGRDRAAYWDGRNALGEQVASGLYFYQLETDEMSLMRKMVILK